MKLLEWTENNPWLSIALLALILDGLAKICHALTGRGCS